MKAGLKIWQTNYTSQSGGASQRGELFHMELTTFGQLIWSKWENFSKWNEGIRYLLMVIDVFSKFGWIRPLKDKRGQSVADAFKDIFKTKRKPKMLWSDKGSEFFNAIMKDLLSKNGIKLYTTENEEKSSVC